MPEWTETGQPCVPSEVDHLSRPEAIVRLRAKLKTLANEEHCVCAAVGRLGIFCRGFSRLSETELREKFDWIARHHPGKRETLEALANLYHLARQEATGAEICCDVETREHIGCNGWNEFDNQRLEQFYFALIGTPVHIG